MGQSPRRFKRRAPSNTRRKETGAWPASFHAIPLELPAYTIVYYLYINQNCTLTFLIAKNHQIP